MNGSNEIYSKQHRAYTFTNIMEQFKSPFYFIEKCILKTNGFEKNILQRSTIESKKPKKFCWIYNQIKWNDIIDTSQANCEIEFLDRDSRVRLIITNFIIHSIYYSYELHWMSAIHSNQLNLKFVFFFSSFLPHHKNCMWHFLSFRLWRIDSTARRW